MCSRSRCKSHLPQQGLETRVTAKRIVHGIDFQSGERIGTLDEGPMETSEEFFLVTYARVGQGKERRRIQLTVSVQLFEFCKRTPSLRRLP